MTKAGQSDEGWARRLGAWAVAVLGLVVLILVIGASVWVVAEAGYEPAETAAGLLVAFGLLLLAVHLIVAVLRRVGLLSGQGREQRGGERPRPIDRAPGESPSAWHPERTFEKAERALEQGQLWRAKEILQGTLASQNYHAELYERYGQVLLQMGDHLNAGKYLFLSGARRATYEEPIALFLRRYRGKDPRQLVRTFPSRARRIDRLPANVIAELERRGWSRKALQKAAPAQAAQPLGWLGAITAAYFLLALVAMLLIGAATLLGKSGGFLSDLLS